MDSCIHKMILNNLLIADYLTLRIMIEGDTMLAQYFITLGLFCV